MTVTGKFTSGLRRFGSLLVVAAVCGTPAAVMAQLPAKASASTTSRQPPIRSISSSRDIQQHETVLVIGGSMAFGWKDPHNDSYLRRAFVIRSHDTKVDYHYVNHAIPGYTAQRLNQRYPGAYERWLQRNKPQVVVLSWGLENDMSSGHRDSIDTFDRCIKQEVAEALAAHSTVLMVTPPVTKELATTDHRKVQTYIHSEFEMGRSFHSNNVFEFDVYRQMQAYMKAHHQTYKRYYGNCWHPNQAGHELAGRLFADALRKRFGSGPIRYRVSHRSTMPSQSERLGNQV